MAASPDSAASTLPMSAVARAPRVADRDFARLHPAPAALAGAVVGVLTRDIRGLAHSTAQLLTHWPATPLVALSWYQGFRIAMAKLPAGRVSGAPEAASGPWEPIAADVTLSGSQSCPSASWAPCTGRGGMVLFTVDAAERVLGVNPQDVHDRVLAADAVLDASWRPLLADLRAAADDAATLRAVTQHLAPRWHALQGRATSEASIRQRGRHWVQRLALQAHHWRRTTSARQVERRIKAASGRSLRDWQRLVRTEGVFFAARDRYEQGMPFDWADIAQAEGFADQAHLIRATRQITGFSPTEFADRYARDESFWMYRLWV